MVFTYLLARLTLTDVLLNACNLALQDRLRMVLTVTCIIILIVGIKPSGVKAKEIDCKNFILSEIFTFTKGLKGHS